MKDNLFCRVFIGQEDEVFISYDHEDVSRLYCFKDGSWSEVRWSMNEVDYTPVEITDEFKSLIAYHQAQLAVYYGNLADYERAQ